MNERREMAAIRLGKPTVGIVGGGLAGLAAAVALAPHCEVELFEARRTLGGRAASFRDPESGLLIDHCQHVSMGCCTNLTDFCRRTGIEDLFTHEDVLHFIGPDARRYDLAATRWLPAPLHLAPAMNRLAYLTRRERRAIALTMWRMFRWRKPKTGDEPTIGRWLSEHGQSPRVVEMFWTVILVSALSEKLERISMSAARQVFVDGFAASSEAYRLQVPRVSLGELYGARLTSWLEGHGVQLRLGQVVKQISGTGHDLRIGTSGEEPRRFDFVVAALPWRQTPALFADSLRAQIPALESVAQLQSAPITGVHLWFDSPITDLPHAVLVGRLGQWLFNRNAQDQATDSLGQEYYYQVVISASHELAGQDKQQVIQQVVNELCEIWPAARDAGLLRGRVVTEPAAVFSMTPGVEKFRPPQRTPVAGLMLAGDWTATGWPATMEGAVRSGYRAAEAVLADIGQPSKLLAPDLPRSWLAKLLFKGTETPTVAEFDDAKNSRDQWPIEEFARFVAILRRSTLVSESALEEALRCGGQSRNLPALKDALVNRGLLTRWQCARLDEDRWRGFFVDGYELRDWIKTDDNCSHYCVRAVSDGSEAVMRVTPAKLSAAGKPEFAIVDRKTP